MSLTCRFCDEEAVARFALSDGCVCFPADREQALCLHHVYRASPRGDMTLLEILDEPVWTWYLASLTAAP